MSAVPDARVDGAGVDDVLVVGGGAAGCETAWGLAQRGVPTTLLTTSLDTLYALPADAWPERPPIATLWATVAAEAADADGRQRAGPLRRAAKRELERQDALKVVQSNANALLRSEGRVLGVRTWEGPEVRAGTTVLAVGSFLGARLTMGAARERAGRLSEMAYDDLRDDLRDAGVAFARREAAREDEGGAPGYRVTYDVWDPAELEAPAGVPAGAARVRRWRSLWVVGACAFDVGIVGAAAAGRDLGAYLAGRGAGR